MPCSNGVRYRLAIGPDRVILISRSTGFSGLRFAVSLLVLRHATSLNPAWLAPRLTFLPEQTHLPSKINDRLLGDDGVRLVAKPRGGLCEPHDAGGGCDFDSRLVQVRQHLFTECLYWTLSVGYAGVRSGQSILLSRQDWVAGHQL